MRISTGMLVLGVAVCAFSFAAPGFAETVSDKKKTMAGLYLTAEQAAEMLESESTLFVDARTRSEVTFLGLPTRVNVNIPFMVLPAFPEYDAGRQTYKLEVNENFADDILSYISGSEFHLDSPIILICRSGSRSARAANILTDMGFTNVYSVVDGYEGDIAQSGPLKGQRVVNGWRNAGLEWSYKISEFQVYPEDLY